MKTKNVCLKVLLCVLCLALAVSCLFACGNDEQVNDLTDKTNKVEQDVNDLKTLVDTIKATAEKAATAAALTEAVSKSDASFADLKAQLAALAGENDELAAAIAAAATKADLEKAVDEFNAKVDEAIADLQNIETEIETIKDQLEALDSDTVFASEFLAATNELWNGEYSLANFDATVARVVADDYPVEVYEAFVDAAAELRHFLTRAITVDAIIGYFADLDAYIADMPDLVESISMFVEETETVVLLDKDNARGAAVKDADDIASIKLLKDKADAQGAVFSDALIEKYDAIIGAFDALETAKANSGEVVALIDAIGYVVYDASNDPIKSARDEFKAFAENNFSNADYAEFYDDNVAESVVENYSVLVAAEARYAQLSDARSNKVVVSAIALEYNSERPLFNELDALKANLDLFNAWCETYEIDTTDDAESINTIYYENNVNEYSLLKSAYTYAKAMNDLYNNIYVGVVNAEALSVEELIANITAYTSKAALYTDADAVDALIVDVENLKNNITNVNDYVDALDGNYEAMGMVDVEAALRALDAVIAGFETAAGEIEAVVDAMNAHKNSVDGIGYTDGDIIIGYETALDEIRVDYEIGSEGANYDALLADAYELQDELFQIYAALVQKVKDLYDDVTAEIAADWALKDGNKVIYFAAELRKFVIDLGIVTIDIPLDNADDDHATQEINLKDLYDTFLDKATEYKQFALSAQADAAVVAEKISKIPANYKDLKSYNAISDAYDALVDWIENYLEVEFDASTNYEAMFEEIVDIVIYGEDDAYDFVTADEYNKVVEAYIENKDAYDDAADEWADIKADMEVLIATNGTDIHYWNNDIADTSVNFVDVAAAWAKYIQTYYSNDVDDTTCVHNEFATVDNFEVAYSVCEGQYEFAVDDAHTIITLIESLDEVTYVYGVTNADEVLVAIDVIEGLIEDYEANYCSDDCLFGDSMVKLAQVKATALFANECAAKYVEIDAALYDKLATIWDNTVEDISYASTEKLVDKCLQTGESKLTLLN